ncbi:MAG: FAD-linked oxidase C-terminal domain-containing protein [Candidatus Korobacteraceae bacterium]
MHLPAVVDQLRKIAGREAVLDRPEDLMLYEYDAGVRKCTPVAVVFPQSTEQVAEIMRLATSAGFPVVARGAGTGLSGGAIAPEGGVVLAFARMNRVLDVDAENMRAIVQPGVVNLQLSEHVAHLGLYFAPDPSSQKACTIGGNVAENSGGPHTLMYGVTVNHVTGLTVVLPSGDVVHFGGKAAESSGYDLTGFFVGSEGTLGVVTEITVRLLRRPERIATLLGIFETIDDGAKTVSAITAAGITPAALEMLDGWTLRAVEAACHAGYPLDAGAVLLIELEGLAEQVEEQAEAVSEVCLLQKAREVRRAKDENERALLWKGRKNAFAALGRLAPSYYSQDGVVPRTKIPAVLQFIQGVAEKYGLRIGNIFHAGDGNLHPLILFDPRDPAQLDLVQAAGAEILECCVAMGGSITGEHGVGLEKRDLMPLLFSNDDLDVMLSLRNAFNAAGVLNPGKLFPTTRMCRETSGPSSNPVLQAEGM